MGSKITFFYPNDKFRVGMTLVEIMVAMAVGSIVLLVLASVTLYSARNFRSMVNYTSLNKDSRMALDRISKEIRQSSGLVSRTPTSLVLKSDNGKELSYVYDANKKELSEDGVPMLKNCTFWTNEIFQRTPIAGKFDYIPATDAAQCKMVQITWTCSRETMQNQENTADIQSMKVVIRKKPD